jgi:hypothetical protein
MDESSPEDKLYSEIGKLKTLVDWLKKSLGNEPGRAGRWIGQEGDTPLTTAAREECPDEEDGRLRALNDEESASRRFYGSRRMAVFLRGRGHRVNRKHVQRPMREMGWRAWRGAQRRARFLRGTKPAPTSCAGWRSRGRIRCGACQCSICSCHNGSRSLVARQLPPH